MPAALALVVAGAALVRLAGLATQPGGLYPDEGAEGLDAWRILHEPGYHPLWFYSDAGREVLYGYTVAGVFKFFGENAIVLRGVSAMFGVLGVVAIYFALRRFGRGAALAAAAWTAGSLWLIAVSRDGMRNITVPFFAALIVWALIAWADRPSRKTAILAGVAVGAGFWTYQPLKLTPLLVAVWLAWIWWRDRKKYHRMMRQLRWIEPAFVLVVLPILVFALVDPNAYFSRAVSVSPLASFNRDISLVDHSLRTLGMFAITGDPNERHDVNGLPLLGWPIFALACVGAWRAWRNRDDPAHSLLLVGIPMFLIPPLLGVDGGVPHFLRSLGLAPFLAGLIGIGSRRAGGPRLRAAPARLGARPPSRASRCCSWGWAQPAPTPTSRARSATATTPSPSTSWRCRSRAAPRARPSSSTSTTRWTCASSPLRPHQRSTAPASRSTTPGASSACSRGARGSCSGPSARSRRHPGEGGGVRPRAGQATGVGGVHAGAPEEPSSAADADRAAG